MNQRNLRDNHISKLNTSQQNLFEAAKLIGQMIIKSFGPFGLEKLTINNYLFFNTNSHSDQAGVQEACLEVPPRSVQRYEQGRR